ncbi:hypothetical protein IC619_009985 [Hazenella sp. IB182353]|uniref:hypothetical protein n=1 Tax=Polycladospora coralii TaxID=2771432 RepID=UPI001746CAAD|nr:hypothetical protein [Polycladospora coralii]MBS7530819.1 hypothetical protein [Polycladospora coralii]
MNALLKKPVPPLESTSIAVGFLLGIIVLSLTSNLTTTFFTIVGYVIVTKLLEYKIAAFKQTKIPLWIALILNIVFVVGALLIYSWLM